MRETEYQQYLKKRIKKLIPDAIVLKNDPNWLQGFPDLTILHKDSGKYALLEVKKDGSAPCRPNQEYYINDAAKAGVFSAFIFPENENEVLDGLQQSLEA